MFFQTGGNTKRLIVGQLSKSHNEALRIEMCIRDRIYSDNAAETRKERRERYGSYKNVSIERDKKREKQKANAAAEKDEQDE